MTSDRRYLRLDQGNDTGHQVQFNVWLIKEYSTNISVSPRVAVRDRRAQSAFLAN